MAPKRRDAMMLDEKREGGPGSFVGIEVGFEDEGDFGVAKREGGCEGFLTKAEKPWRLQDDVA